MKRMLLLAVISANLANAGIIRFVTYPVRHPVKTVKKAGHIVKVVVW